MLGQKKGLSKESLIDLLELLVEDLQKKEMLPELHKDQATALIDTVLDNIFDNNKCNLHQFNFDMRDNAPAIKDLMKLFELSLKSEFESNKEINPAAKLKLKFDYSKLFSDELTNKDELKKELENMLEEMNKLAPKPKFTSKQIENIAEALASSIIREQEKLATRDQELTAQNRMTVDVFAEALCTLFGGVDPRFGGQARNVNTVLGDFMGLANYDQGLGVGSYMTKRNRAEPGEPDPTGAEANTITNAISNGTFGDEVHEIIDRINHPTAKLNPQ
jgi:hypothetical protein